MKSVFIFFSSS